MKQTRRSFLQTGVLAAAGTTLLGHSAWAADAAMPSYLKGYEALYATDVLRDLEEMKPLRRREQPRMDSLAA